MQVVLFSYFFPQERIHNQLVTSLFLSLTLKPARKGSRESAKSSTPVSKMSKGFTDEERAAKKERIQELKADGSDGENAVLVKIAEMPEPDRTMGKQLHAIIKTSAPALSPRLWYGMPAYARDSKVVCFFQPAQKFKTRYAKRTSTKAPCGQPPSR